MPLLYDESTPYRETPAERARRLLNQPSTNRAVPRSQLPAWVQQALREQDAATRPRAASPPVPTSRASLQPGELLLEPRSRDEQLREILDSPVQGKAPGVASWSRPTRREVSPPHSYDADPYLDDQVRQDEQAGAFDRPSAYREVRTDRTPPSVPSTRRWYDHDEHVPAFVRLQRDHPALDDDELWELARREVSLRHSRGLDELSDAAALAEFDPFAEPRSRAAEPSRRTNHDPRERRSDPHERPPAQPPRGNPDLTVQIGPVAEELTGGAPSIEGRITAESEAAIAREVARLGVQHPELLEAEDGELLLRQIAQRRLYAPRNSRGLESIDYQSATAEFDPGNQPRLVERSNDVLPQMALGALDYGLTVLDAPTFVTRTAIRQGPQFVYDPRGAFVEQAHLEQERGGFAGQGIIDAAPLRWIPDHDIPFTDLSPRDAVAGGVDLMLPGIDDVAKFGVRRAIRAGARPDLPAPRAARALDDVVPELGDAIPEQRLHLPGDDEFDGLAYGIGVSRELPAGAVKAADLWVVHPSLISDTGRYPSAVPQALSEPVDELVRQLTPFLPSEQRNAVRAFQGELEVRGAAALQARDLLIGDLGREQHEAVMRSVAGIAAAVDDPGQARALIADAVDRQMRALASERLGLAGGAEVANQTLRATVEQQAGALTRRVLALIDESARLELHRQHFDRLVRALASRTAQQAIDWGQRRFEE